MKRNTLVVFALSLAVALRAQDADSSGRGVARLSLLAGDVSVRHGDAGEIVAAAVNAPLLGEDHLLTGDGARAEIQFDYAHFARLSSNSELRLADIENRKYLIRLARGTMNFRVLRSSEASTEISTPSIAIRPLKKGMYRLSVLDDGSTQVTVRSGEAEIFTPRGSQRLKSGKTLIARGDYNDPEFQFANATMTDEWDRWNENRDRQLENSRNYDYVSRDITGAEDLDGHGRWVQTEEYGNVWAPSAAADWAPYRNGRWSWVDYYGWNWISYDPWGWAPYHYGRWINRPSIGWCWWPGRINSRHFWSPAQVAFFGWGGGFGGGLSIGFGGGFGNWGWVPLAPFEPFYPWYGRSFYGGFRNGGRNNVTIINNTNITNIYRNARHNNGITSVNAGQFGRGSVNNVRFNRNDIERASVVRGQLPLVPDALSRRMSDRESRVSDSRGAGRSDDRFYSTRQASRVDRVPFENQRAAMQEVSRRTFGDSNSDSNRRGGEVAGGRGSDATGAGRGAARGGDASAGRSLTDSAVRNESPSTSRGGDATSGRGGEASAGRGTTRALSGDSADRGGWRRFGDSAAPATADRGAGRGAEAGVGRGARDPGRIDRGTGATNSDTGGWRRFGDSAAPAATDRGTGAVGGADSGDRGGWRRFGDSTSNSSERGAGRGGNVDTGSWRRMSESPSINRGAIDRGAIGDRGNTDSGRRSVDRGIFDRGGRGSSGADSPRLSAPPVVRERSTPDFGSRGGGFGGSRGEGRQQSAPRMERSAPSAPSMQRSAPSAPSGNPGGGRGEGGGGRSEGRGGGGRVR